jgi:hypothetical protein
MFTTLTLSTLMLFAPAQAGQPPKVGGAGVGGFGMGMGMPSAPDPAPRIVELKPDAQGKIKITVTRSKPFNPPAMPGVPAGMFPAMKLPTPESVELTAVKNLKITTTTGKEVKVADAVKTLAKGGYVLVSSDGKEVPSAILRLFSEDVMVLVSPELARNDMNGIMMGGGGPGVGGGIIGNPVLPAPKAK